MRIKNGYTGVQFSCIPISNTNKYKILLIINKSIFNIVTDNSHFALNSIQGQAAKTESSTIVRSDISL